MATTYRAALTTQAFAPPATWSSTIVALPPSGAMKPPKNHRCGKHVAVANPASQIPLWVACQVHRSGHAQIHDQFTNIVHLEFYGEEILRLGWTVEYGMLD
jgi:hypothetical protein